MKQQYYTFLIEHNLNNILSEISELSYTQKINILSMLIFVDGYTNEQINMALNYYKINYIDLNRVQCLMIYGVLKGYIKRGLK